jgi:transcriptional regulator with XRE-family HTH domain
VILAKFIRLSNGWSQLDAASRIGIGHALLSLIEVKRYVPTPQMLQRMANVFHVSPPEALLRDVKIEHVRIEGTTIGAREAEVVQA